MPPSLPLASDAPADDLTAWDWFAGQALNETASLIDVTKPGTFVIVARIAADIADAMMAERAKRQTG